YKPELPQGINGPLNILRRSILRFNPPSQCGKCTYLLIGETCLCIATGQLNLLRPTTSTSPNGKELLPQMSPGDLTGGGMHLEVIGIDRAGDDRLTKAGTGIDHCLPTTPGQWVS